MTSLPCCTAVGTIQLLSCCSLNHRVIMKGSPSAVSSSWILYSTYMSFLTPSPGYQRSSAAKALLVRATDSVPNTSSEATNVEERNLELIKKNRNAATDKCLFQG